MKIYDALKKDHEEVKSMLRDLIAMDDKDESRFGLAEKIRDALIPHSRAEEAVFYNSLRAQDADSGKVLHGFTEHAEAEAMLRTLLFKEKVNLDWKSTAVKLQKALDHHIQEEETELFALGRKVLSDADAEKIGVAFERMKPEINAESMLASTKDLIMNLLPTSQQKVQQKINHV